MTGSKNLAVAFPLALDEDGSSRLVQDPPVAAEQLIEQLLFTAPGDRLNQPELGCGLPELLFDPLSTELQAATQFQVASALQRWLADVVKVVSLTVTSSGSEIDVTVVYTLLDGGGSRTMKVRR
jgi:uncharacterized protein